MAEHAPEFKPGMELTSGDLNKLGEVADRAGLIPAGAGVAAQRSPGGTATYVRNTRIEVWAKIGTAISGSSYHWTQQLAAASGTWATGPRTDMSGAKPAYEVNGSTTVPANTIVRLWLERSSGTWLFQYTQCS